MLHRVEKATCHYVSIEMQEKTEGGRKRGGGVIKREGITHRPRISHLPSESTLFLKNRDDGLNRLENKLHSAGVSWEDAQDEGLSRAVCAAFALRHYMQN